MNFIYQCVFMSLPLNRLLAMAPHGAIGLESLELMYFVLYGSQSEFSVLADTVSPWIWLSSRDLT